MNAFRAPARRPTRGSRGGGLGVQGGREESIRRGLGSVGPKVSYKLRILNLRLLIYNLKLILSNDASTNWRKQEYGQEYPRGGFEGQEPCARRFPKIGNGDALSKPISKSENWPLRRSVQACFRKFAMATPCKRQFLNAW